MLQLRKQWRPNCRFVRAFGVLAIYLILIMRGIIHISAPPPPPPDSWLAACIAGLTPEADLQVFLSWGSTSTVMSFHWLQLFCQFLPCHLLPLWPTHSINLYITCGFHCTARALHIIVPAKPSFSKWGQDPGAQASPVALLILWWPHSLTWLQICKIMALPLHSSTEGSAWSMWLQICLTWPCHCAQAQNYRLG